MSRIASRRTSTNVCCVNEDFFSKAFEDVPKTTINSVNDVKDIFDNSAEILLMSTDDWTKRNQQLKLIRSVIIFSKGVVDKERMIPHLNKLSDVLELSIKDLRSQVLREAAITCSFIMKTYGREAQKIASAIFDAAMSQVAVSTKIMSTSGATLTTFIVKYVHTKQIFNSIISYSTSKDKNIRKQVARLIEVIVVDWEDKTKIQFMQQICDLIKAAICDADLETRTVGRTAFQKLEENNPREADSLFQTLDSKRQKTLRVDDGCGSNSSLNSERSIPIRSKLSFGGRPTSAAANTRFLSQRSSSASDSNIAQNELDNTPKYVRPGIKSNIDTSPGGSKFSRPLSMGPRTSSNMKSARPTSQIGSRNFSPNRSSNQVKREKSNLSSTFFNNLPKTRKEQFQKCMDKVQFQMRQPSLNGDDEFLLPKRSVSFTPRSPRDISKVDFVLNSCKSNSPVEKKEGIKKLSSLISSTELSECDVKKIGTMLTRILMECSNTIVLETISTFVEKYHAILGDWLKICLFRIFNKKANEVLPNMKEQLSFTMSSIMKSFDPGFQLKTLCIIICDPIQCMTPKTRIVLMEYTNDLLSGHIPAGHAINTPELKSSMFKLFSWFSDQKHGATFSQHIENIICNLFTVNAADFSSLFSDFDPTYREKAYTILQTHGHQQVVDSEMEIDDDVEQNICDTNYEISDYVNNEISASLSQPSNSSEKFTEHVESRKNNIENCLPLKSLNSKFNSANNTNDRAYNSTFEHLSGNSTNNLINDRNEQNNYVFHNIAKMKDFDTSSKQLEGANGILEMLRDGSFTLWDQYFVQLVLAIFDILEHRQASGKLKIVALRLLYKICNVQAARLFDSTEMAILRVLDSGVDCQDKTIIVAAEHCLKILATHLPLPKIVNTACAVMSQESLDTGRSEFVLKMITHIFESLQIEEIEPFIDDIAPCATTAYGSSSSAVRKTAVYCLVAMVNKVGFERMEKHLNCLSSRQMNLIKLYVARRMSSRIQSHA